MKIATGQGDAARQRPYVRVPDHAAGPKREAFLRACFAAGVVVMPTRPSCPCDKSTVERLHGGLPQPESGGDVAGTASRGDPPGRRERRT
jgi:hypothetical protein